MQFAMSDINGTQYNIQECIIFNISLKTSRNFQVIYHYIVNL